MLTCRNRATLSPSLPNRMRGNRRSKARSRSTSFSKSTSVPGRRHTATFGSPMAAKPRVRKSKLRRHQFVADLCRSRRDVVQCNRTLKVVLLLRTAGMVVLLFENHHMTMAITCRPCDGRSRNDRRADKPPPLAHRAQPLVLLSAQQFGQPWHAKRHAEWRYRLKCTDIHFCADDGAQNLEFMPVASNGIKALPLFRLPEGSLSVLVGRH